MRSLQRGRDTSPVFHFHTGLSHVDHCSHAAGDGEEGRCLIDSSGGQSSTAPLYGNPSAGCG